MALIDNGLPEMRKPSEDDLREWKGWVSTRPPIIQEMCQKIQPWHYYDMPKTGQIAVVRSYSENRTVTVLIVGDQISIPSIVEMEVFGVNPDDLVLRLERGRHDS